MPKPQLFLHVGSQKTGSTTIQRVLDANRDQLAAAGFVYPRNSDALTTTDRYHDRWARLIATEEDRDIAERYATSILEQLEPGQKVILSAEALSRATVGSDADHVTRRRGYLDRVRQLLDDFEVTVVVFLRRHDTFADSLYRELAVKRGGAGRFPNFSRWLRRSADRFPYEPQVALYREMFADTKVLNFDATLQDAGPVSAFFGAIGAPVPAGADDVHARPSADARVVLWLRSQSEGQRTMRQAFAWSDRARAVFDDPGKPVMWSSEKERAAFLAEFTGEYGTEYFGPPKPYTYHAQLLSADAAKLDEAWEDWRLNVWASARTAKRGIPGDGAALG